MTEALTKPGAPSTWLTREERLAVTDKSLTVGLAILGVHLALYAATIVVAVAPLPLAVNIAAGVVNGILIGMLFIIGHDASHGSFVPGKRWNQALARIAFLAPAHSASLWDIVHNRIHHGRTNLKGFDYVWAPMSKAEYDKARPFRRWLERVYRSPFGPLVYYYIEFWVPKVVVPWSPESRDQWRAHVPDMVFVLGGLLATIAIVGGLGAWLAPERPLWASIVLGWVIPFAVWNYIMALTIYIQHTHPSVPWFSDEETWTSYDGNIRGSTHVELPVVVAPLWNMVLGHTAHHVMPSIPIYKLPRAQKRLLARYGDDIAQVKLWPSTYLAITRACKLFDFERMCWTDFEGRPTGPSLSLHGKHNTPAPAPILPDVRQPAVA